MRFSAWTLTLIWAVNWLVVEVPNAITKNMPVVLLALMAGILFLASWWKSRTSGTPQNGA